MESLFEEFEEKGDSGYRLDKFQLLNWGLFDKNIYTVDAKNESTLLTGKNGSGKTTLVDAILTLLVPNQMRFYNQSSGSTHKKDRNEESYVLGAYGSKQAGESTSSKTQYLRDSETISILNGIFYCEKNQSFVSLIQVRYFQNGELQRFYGVTRKSIIIEEIYSLLERTASNFDKAGKWRKLMANSFNTVFFANNFKKYSDTFSSIFGFRSENALKLFSQIVGLKVLDNINDFIRTNMLEPTETEAEFEKLQENYTKLIQCDKEIQKTKSQLELLQNVVNVGNDWKKFSQEKEKFLSLKSVHPAWYSQKSKKFYETEEKSLEINLESVKESEKSKKNLAQSVQEEIDSLNVALSKSDVSTRIREIENAILNLNEKNDSTRKNQTKYCEKCEILDLHIPTTENAFEKNKEQIPVLQEKFKNQKSDLENKQFLIQKKIEENKIQTQEIKSELFSLGNRNSNIPLKNIEIRQKICSGTRLEESDLQFAGELIKVKEGEEKWNLAIEKLLHNFALTILVSQKNYKKVVEFVKSTDLGGRVVFLKTEDELDFEIKEENCDFVPGKLSVKQNHELTSWILSYISSHFNFLCTDEFEEIAKTERCVTSLGLIKNGIRHEKDDRKVKIENVLGWDNTEKRRLLSENLDSLESEKSKIESENQQIRNQISKIDEKIFALSSILEFASFDSIDFEKIVKQISNLQNEKEKLSKDKSIADLQSKLESKKEEKSILENEISDLTKNLGKIESKLSDIKEKLIENEKIFEIYFADSEIKEKTESEIVNFENEFVQEITKINSIHSLTENSKLIGEVIEKSVSRNATKIDESRKRLILAMEKIKSPNQTLKDKFGDWGNEFADFGMSEEYFDDYVAFFERLNKDDLPKYEKQFHEYLQNTINQDIIDFSEHINSSLQKIQIAVNNLNSSLAEITYQKNPDTHLQLVVNKSNDQRIRDFRNRLNSAKPDAYEMSRKDSEYEEKLFNKIKSLFENLKANQNTKDFILDLRNWFVFAASENFASDNSQKQFYNDSASLSGGEKAKLTYTILASAIAYQFGIEKKSENNSFRFAIIDEAFSKSDTTNSEYAMNLFKQLNLQIMVVTPMDKINIVEDYISSIHLTEKTGTDDSRLISMPMSKYKKAE